VEHAAKQDKRVGGMRIFRRFAPATEFRPKPAAITIVLDRADSAIAV